MNVAPALGPIVINHAVQGVEGFSLAILVLSCRAFSVPGVNNSAAMRHTERVSGAAAGDNPEISVTTDCMKTLLLGSCAASFLCELKSVMKMARVLRALTCFTCLDTAGEDTWTLVLSCLLGPEGIAFGCNVSEITFFFFFITGRNSLRHPSSVNLLWLLKLPLIYYSMTASH